MSYCTHCGAQNVEGSEFCASCGQTLSVSAAQPPGSPVPPPPPAPGMAPAQPQYAPPAQPYAAPQQPVAPGYPQQAPPTWAQPPKSGLVNAIFATLCCCMPAGVVSIVYAAQVNSKWTAGDYAGAQDAAKKANMWATIAVVLGLILILIQIVVGALSPDTFSSY